MTRRPIGVYAIRSKRSYWLGHGLAAVAFACACGFALRGAGGWFALLGVAGLLLFGVMSAYAARQLLRAGPRLTLGPDGVDVAGLGIGRIPWEGIESVEMFGSAEAPFVALHLRDPDALLARLPPLPRLLVRLQRASGLPPLSVSLVGVDRGLAEISGRIRQGLATAREPAPPPTGHIPRSL
ncbi:MAG: hypothetical protein EOP93_08820 [Lysobacteraceae bacterium]|nr:MAG: hypothetical protein EOP93_08820 [Xanthomonadaceae bacterium]